MKVYAGMDPRLPLADVAAHARRIESLGYDGLHVAETIHDPFMVSLLALQATTSLTVRTAVALAFTRSPMLTALTAWDLSVLSNGRFHLGLGSQIRQNIEGRYGMPWAEPIGRMRDYLEAVEACFSSFASGDPLKHVGPHYQLTRLQPYFNPGPSPEVAIPPLYLGGVNPRICQLAGEVADGFVTHPTNSSPLYLERSCLPHLLQGLAAAGRERSSLELVVGTQVITGHNAEALDQERERQRRLFAFLYSTPAYAPTLELYGWAHLTSELRSVVRDNAWDRLEYLVTNDILDTLLPTGRIDELAALLLDRFTGLADGILLSVPSDPNLDAGLKTTISQLKDGAA